MWDVTIQYNTIQYNTIQYNTIQYNTIQYNTIQYNTIQYNTIQYNTIQYNTMQCNAMQCNAMQCNAMQYNTIQYNTIQCNGMQCNAIQYLRNRKHVPCFYRVIQTRVEVWENEKCCGNTSRRRVFPKPFRVLPNFHECLYNSIETRSTCFLFLLENATTRKRKTTC